jgi:Ca-activated chloride channel homolog
MNNDETDLPKKVKTNPEADAPLGAELEARVVAAVVGEASAFEAAELERIAAATPAVAEFKQRIESMHGLVAEAAERDPQPLRLSAERRAKLLATIGSTETPAKENVLPLSYARKNAWRTQRWIIGMAACAMFCVFLSIEVSPRFFGVTRPARPDPSQTILGGAGSSGPAATRMIDREAMVREAQVKAAPEYRAVAMPSAVAAAPSAPRVQDFATNLNVGGTITSNSRSFVLADGAATASAPVAMALPPADGIVRLDAFEVSAPREGNTMAMSASRMNAAPMPPALLNLSEVEKTNAEIRGRDISRVGSDDQAKAENRFVLSDDVDRLRTLNEAPAAGQRAQETVTLNEAPLTISLFQVSSDKDAGYAPKATADAKQAAVVDTVEDRRGVQDRLASERSPQQELVKKRAEEAKGLADKQQVVLTEAATLNLGSLSAAALTAGGLAGSGKEKADAPLARPKLAADDSLRVETSTATQAVSTFSLHVSDVSFRLAQAALARGQMPEVASIRPEEFYNAFNYGDSSPAVAEKVGCRIEQSAHPFLAQRNLARIAMKVAATGRVGGTPLRLTVLLDTSGSMEREDRVATVRRAMEVLVSLLGPNDRLTLIGFARQPRLLAENLPGDRAREVLDLIARTPAEGGTNMEEALKLATQLALRHRGANTQNRIVMLTDGAANLGNAEPARLAAGIAELRQRSIAFDACGVGLDGLDDGILEALTRQGDGRYYVLNSPDDADGGFAQKLAGAFRPAAENVKLQVRFNPARVATYRLIGFEQHRLREQDFRNDKVDAAELAAEEAGVALYQFEPLPQGEGDVGEVFVRFRDAATGAMVERSWAIPYDARAPAFDRATPSLQLAGVAALLAEKLRADANAGQITLRDFATVVSTLQAHYRNEPRVQELVTMFAQARRLTGQ